MMPSNITSSNWGEPTLHENRFANQQPQLLALAPEQWQRVSQRKAGQQRRRISGGRAQLCLPGISLKK